MKRLLSFDNRGIALLMTLAFITLAISLAVETNRQARFAIESTAAIQNRYLAGQIAAAGIHGAMAILIQDRYDSEMDHLKEVWADPDQLAEALSALEFEAGRLEVHIADEMARIQVNALVDFPVGRQFNSQQQQILMRLIDVIREANEEQSDLSSADIVNAIKDWLDHGDDDAITGLNGAESDFYETLEPPYRARNGPMVHIGDLARVKGVTPGLFAGGTAAEGLKDCLTVFGVTQSPGDAVAFSGRVNLNTVGPQVLAALLPQEYRDVAEAIIQYREDAEAETLASPSWYQGIPGAAGLELNQDLFTLTSDIFRIRAIGFSGGIRREIVAVVERRPATGNGGWTCHILAWEASG